MCCHKPRGRSENRIFGNCVFPENGAYQVASGFIFFGWFLLVQKPSIRSSEIFFGIPFRPNSPLGQGHQRATDREMTLPRDATDFDSQWSRDTNALTNSSIFLPFERRAFEIGFNARAEVGGAEAPGYLELAEVSGGDLIERRVAGVAEIAAIGWPFALVGSGLRGG